MILQLLTLAALTVGATSPPFQANITQLEQTIHAAPAATKGPLTLELAGLKAAQATALGRLADDATRAMLKGSKKEDYREASTHHSRLILLNAATSLARKEAAAIQKWLLETGTPASLFARITPRLLTSEDPPQAHKLLAIAFGARGKAGVALAVSLIKSETLGLPGPSVEVMGELSNLHSRRKIAPDSEILLNAILAAHVAAQLQAAGKRIQAAVTVHQAAYVPHQGKGFPLKAFRVRVQRQLASYEAGGRAQAQRAADAKDWSQAKHSYLTLTKIFGDHYRAELFAARLHLLVANFSRDDAGKLRASAFRLPKPAQKAAIVDLMRAIEGAAVKLTRSKSPSKQDISKVRTMYDFLLSSTGGVGRLRILLKAGDALTVANAFEEAARSYGKIIVAKPLSREARVAAKRLVALHRQK